MFFPRLRRHAKWMFVLLALVFGLGFVVFGVGAGGTGIGDIFRDQGGTSSGQSVSDAQKQAADNPKSPQAWRDLSTAYQTEGETGDAIDALNRVDRASPEVARGLPRARRPAPHPGRASSSSSSSRRRSSRPSARRAPRSRSLTTKSGQATLTDPLQNAVSSDVTRQPPRRSTSRPRPRPSLRSTRTRSSSRLQPNDPNIQLELAQTAQQTGDVTTAIAAYQRFLTLAPDDPNASVVRAQLKQLRKNASG